MSENKNPSLKSINIRIQDGPDLLKQKAMSYGHHTKNLKVLELIALIEDLKSKDPEAIETLAYETSKKLGR